MLLEDDRPQDARKFLLRAIEVEPDAGYSKYMYLGQIEGGEEAARLYGKGSCAAVVPLMHLCQFADDRHRVDGCRGRRAA